MDWVQVVNSLGVPVTLLAALGYAFYRVGSYLGPKLAVIVEAHLRLIDDLDKQVTLQTKLIENQNKILDNHTAILSEIRRHLLNPSAAQPR